MKKVLAIIMIAAMAFALAACGNSGSGAGSQDTQPAQTEAVTDAATQADTEATTEVESDADTAGSTEAESDADTAEEAELGGVTGNVYENEFLGIGVKLPDDWTFSTEEEIAEINGFVVDNIGDEQLKEAVANADYYYDMMAVSGDQASNINVLVQKIGALQSLAFNDMEEGLKASEESVIQTLSDMGAEDVKFEIDRGQTFPAENYSCGTVKANVMGVELNERLILFKVGNYMATVTVTTVNGDATKEIIDSFYSMK